MRKHPLSFVRQSVIEEARQKGACVAVERESDGVVAEGAEDLFCFARGRGAEPFVILDVPAFSVLRALPDPKFLQTFTGMPILLSQEWGIEGVARRAVCTTESPWKGKESPRFR